MTRPGEDSSGSARAVVFFTVLTLACCALLVAVGYFMLNGIISGDDANNAAPLQPPAAQSHGPVPVADDPPIP